MAEKEYIERGAMIRGIIESRENSPYTDTESDLVHRIEHNNFLSLVANQPAADVVHIVRCKDCAVPHNKWTGCPKLNGLVTPHDFYCSFAERREDETN